jgi:hypothetical protein
LSSPVTNHQNRTDAAHTNAGAAASEPSQERVESSSSPAPTIAIASATPQKLGSPASDGPSVMITIAPSVPVAQRAAIRISIRSPTWRRSQPVLSAIRASR